MKALHEDEEPSCSEVPFQAPCPTQTADISDKFSQNTENLPCSWKRRGRWKKPRNIKYEEEQTSDDVYRWGQTEGWWEEKYEDDEQENIME